STNDRAQRSEELTSVGMETPENDRGVKTPPQVAPSPPPSSPAPPAAQPAAKEEEAPIQTSISYSPTVDNSDSHYHDPYSVPDSPAAIVTEEHASVPAPVTATGGSSSTPPPPPSTEGDEEEGMLRMSFLEHLEELRKRIFLMLAGIGVAFFVSITFSNRLWLLVQKPAAHAVRELGIKEPKVAQIAPMEGFNVVWMKLPILTSIFIASPWILYQVWSFIAPGLYKRERRWAAPFVICSAGLFIAGGLFAYFVAFRF